MELPFPTEGEGLLLHHWDTDGMSSAALLLQAMESTEVETFTPSIGNYLIDEKDQKKIRKINPDFVIVVDMALPKDSIDFLKDFGSVFIFDHHLQDKHDVRLHHNPVIDGATPKEYPSATWVMTDYLDRKPDLLTILGAFGDREEKLKDNDVAMETVDKVLEELDSDFEEVLKCVELLDSNYKIGEREKVTRMPRFLSGVEKPEGILSREDLQENKEKLKKAIEDEVEGSLNEVKEDVLHKEMDSPYNIISTVARRLAWAREDKIVIASNCNYDPDDCQIYIRGPIENSEAIIQEMKDRGYSAGGKSDVVGMVVPQEDKEEVLEDLIEML
ncbi:MAG: DHH family phosphoesterase [Candidatus Thermoplasmatota archaeon]|nr:DHH family phosphoesterase [Candidatus Thermoplasmatota archaeon]